jgi:hypothetical protein
MRTTWGRPSVTPEKTVSVHIFMGSKYVLTPISLLSQVGLKTPPGNAYTARSERDSFAWRQRFVQAFLERDIPQLGIEIPAVAPGGSCAH